MIRYVAARLASSVPVLLLVCTFSFVIIRWLPGDIAVMRLGDQASPQAVAQLRHVLGTDRPLGRQYLDWLRSSVTGNFGDSESSGRPVTRQFMSAFPVTLELTVLSIAVAMVFALPLGILAALKRHTALDFFIRILSALGQAIPAFWLALVILTLLGIYLHWVPPFTYHSPRTNLPQNLLQFAIPVLILGYGLSAVILRLTRGAMIEVLEHDYIRTARAKGLPSALVLRRHALRNGLIPIVSVVGVQVGQLLGGAIIIEQIFLLPGVGKLTLQAVTTRDYAQLEFNILVFAVIVVVMNLIVDLSYALIDPRSGSG